VSAAVDPITDRVRERVRREGVDLAADSDLADRFVREELRSYSERALDGTTPLIADEQAAARTIIAAVNGLGPLQPLLDDPTVEEVWINAPDGAIAESTRSL
jgi:pilus assembly protein CpaF